MIRFANAALHALHVGTVVFTLIGWIWPQTRPYHLIVCGLTLASWFVLGPLIGQPGHCFLTGFQHRIWGRMGNPNRPNYMSYLAERLTGQPPNARRVELATQTGLYLCTLLSLVLFWGGNG